jgi:hypothetical protein
VALGLINALVLHRLPEWRSRSSSAAAGTTTRLRAMGGISLACWLTAVGAGRMIGYW